MGFRRIAAASCAVVCVAGLAARTNAQPKAERVRGDPAIPRRAHSARALDGTALVGGVELYERAELRLRWPDGPRWARPGLVALLVKAATAVDRRYPGSVLLVGDLSSRAGGSLPGHVSHRSGRDADVAFYLADASGRRVESVRLVPVGASGVAAPGLYFDEARNWALVEALLSDRSARVQTIFVAEPVKHRLLAYARRHDVAASLAARADAAMRQPAHGPPHDDHFHVRIAD